MRYYTVPSSGSDGLWSLLKWGLLGAGVFVGYKLIRGHTEAEEYQKRLAEMTQTAIDELVQKATATPLELTQDEIKLVGTRFPDLLGRIMQNLTQEELAMFQARATGQSYATPEAPAMAEGQAPQPGDPSFIGPVLPS